MLGKPQILDFLVGMGNPQPVYNYHKILWTVRWTLSDFIEMNMCMFMIVDVDEGVSECESGFYGTTHHLLHYRCNELWRINFCGYIPSLEAIYMLHTPTNSYLSHKYVEHWGVWLLLLRQNRSCSSYQPWYNQTHSSYEPWYISADMS